MAKRRDWTDNELRIISLAYVGMLRAQSAGQSFNKSAIRRELLPLLDNRSAGSYESKLMNLSAAAVAIGLDTVRGYKPAPNYQAKMRDVLRAVVAEYPEVFAQWRHDVARRVTA
jgi:hypothetical protein